MLQLAAAIASPAHRISRPPKSAPEKSREIRAPKMRQSVSAG
jgi:hypothetical protein